MIDLVGLHCHSKKHGEPSGFGPSSLHQRDPRSALFEGYDGGGAGRAKNGNASPRNDGGYGYSGSGGAGTLGAERQAYRPATPNSRYNFLYATHASIGGNLRNFRGQYSDATLNELESQNDGQVEGILGKVKQLKDMTIAIGDEIRESSALAEKMNDSFDNTRVRLRGTMNRMLLMAEKTGVGWRVWVGFFAAVMLLFIYVWLF
ncbi:blocked early in transport 1 [Pseudogymnoascus sp. 23342-1-I1]|nr:blocked early in transport 1 [Pseudogymnoascus sp. 23342-1-I1]